MNSIVGIASRHNTVPDLLRSLRQMDRADHNNCGLVVYGRQGHTASAPRLHRHRRAQPISVWMDPAKAPGAQPCQPPNPLDQLQGQVGMGHTGTADTQGPIGLQAVLPHISHGPDEHLNSPAKVAVVAQGQLQITDGLRETLKERGYRFNSNCDCELLAHLLDATHQGHAVQALQRTLGLLTGPVAMGVMFHDQPGHLFAVQRGVNLYWHSNGERTVWASHNNALPCDAGDFKLLNDGLVLELHPCGNGITHHLHG